ncbi:diphosphomevalonate decarboxylase [bacterium]|nr:diphosphomevalonate decarboxylase [bacterium]
MTAMTARACSNIAFIKYWGNADHHLRLPVNSSLSMNLDGIITETHVRWDDTLASDVLILNQSPADTSALQRVTSHLDIIRRLAGISAKAYVESYNIPNGAGIASSASAFAALTVAAAAGAGLSLSERELSTIARMGSGSASRSIPTGFVQWHKAATHEDSYAESIAGGEHWNLVDVIAIVSSDHKAVGSREGHHSADTSDLQAARVAGAEERLRLCKQALFDRDFHTFAEVVEYDSNLMHAVMMTSQPPLFYWQPTTLTLMNAVRSWRAEGLNVCYTLDAGPNVHCICTEADALEVKQRLAGITGVSDILSARPGSAAVVLA